VPLAPSPTAWDLDWDEWVGTQRARRLSQATLAVYDYASKRLAAFRGAYTTRSAARIVRAPITSPEQFDRRAVEQFLVELDSARKPDGQPLSADTIDQHFRVLRQFLRWCARQDRYQRRGRSLITFDVKAPVATEGRIVWFEDDELARLRQAVADNPRDRVILEVLIRTGIRLGELLRLKVSAIGSDGLLVEQTKGSRSHRSIPLVTEDFDLAQALRVYQDRIRPKDDGGSSVLFLQLRKPYGSVCYPPMTKATVTTLLDRAAARAGVDDVFPHKFRHTFATRLIRQRVSLPVVRDLLGHSTLEMVMRYVNVVGADMAESLGMVRFGAVPDQAVKPRRTKAGPRRS